MADARDKASQDESSAVAVLPEAESDNTASTRQLNADEIALLASFFRLLAEWDEADHEVNPHD